MLSVTHVFLLLVLVVEVSTTEPCKPGNVNCPHIAPKPGDMFMEVSVSMGKPEGSNVAAPSSSDTSGCAKHTLWLMPSTSPTWVYSIPKGPLSVCKPKRQTHKPSGRPSRFRVPKGPPSDPTLDGTETEDVAGIVLPSGLA